MSVFLRRGKWVVDYWPDGAKGRHVRKTLPESIKKEADAREIERELRQVAKDPEIHAPVNGTVNTIFPHFLQWYEMHRAPRSYKDIKGCWKNHLSRHLGQYIASEISGSHINIYKRLRKAEYNGNFKTKKILVGNRCIIKELDYFSGFLRWCHKNIKGFPKRDFEIEDLPYERPIPTVLSLEEAVNFIKQAEPLYRVIFLVLFTCGLRFNEARLLKWTDVDFENRTLKLIKKGGKPHNLPITSDWLFDELNELYKLNKLKEHRSQWVFQSPMTGKPDQPITNVHKAVRRAKERAGITKRVYPHLLRHSVATHLLDQDINLRTIQDMLGHTQISTTQWYTQVSTQNLRGALTKGGMNLKPKGGVYHNQIKKPVKRTPDKQKAKRRISSKRVK